jgi:hypothetical protein
MSLRCVSLYTFSNAHPVPCLPHGTMGYRTVPYGSIWWKPVPYGAIWFYMVNAGAIWWKPVLYGAIRFHVVKAGAIWLSAVCLRCGLQSLIVWGVLDCNKVCCYRDSSGLTQGWWDRSWISCWSPEVKTLVKTQENRSGGSTEMRGNKGPV